VIYVDAQRLCANGEKLPEDKLGPRLRGYLWVTPGCLIEGRGPIYRSLDAYLMMSQEPPARERAAWRLGDTRTVIKEGALMIYGTETIQLGGGGIVPKPQIWACRPVSKDDSDGEP